MTANTKEIRHFQDEFYFLSNFYPSEVVLEGKAYPTVEHAFQAAKTRDPEERKRIRKAGTPGKAKQLGHRVTLRKDWEKVKIGIMEALVRDKFSRHPELGAQLLITDKRKIIEENNWNDTFWGECNGKGHNHLGKILMRIREELRS